MKVHTMVPGVGKKKELCYRSTEKETGVHQNLPPRVAQGQRAKVVQEK